MKILSMWLLLTPKSFSWWS